MYTQIELIVSGVLGFALGSSFMIFITNYKQVIASRTKTQKLSKAEVEISLRPFIQIHDLVDEAENQSTKEETNKFKEKIEAFKLRNQFYQT